MRFPKLSWLFLIALAATAAIVHADVVTPTAIDFASILSPPPSMDSDQTITELYHIVQLQETRTPEDVARIKSEANLTVWVYSNVLGSWLHADNRPATGKFLGEVLRETGAITKGAKTFYGRKRPFQIDARVKPCIEVDSSPSYPSGHSDAATVFGLVLSEMFPDQRDALIARSRQIGDDRVLAGVHFPSDVEAGRTLGVAIFKQMDADPDFQEQLRQAVDECQARRTAR